MMNRLVLTRIVYSILTCWLWAQESYARPEIEAPQIVAFSFLGDFDPKLSDSARGTYEMIKKLPKDITPLVLVPSDILKNHLEFYYQKNKINAEILVIDAGTKWARDFFPEFVPDKKAGHFVGFRYVRGDRMSKLTLKKFGEHFKKPTRRIHLIVEGGNLVMDSERRLYITEKVIYANSKEGIESAIKENEDIWDPLDLENEPVPVRSKSEIETLLKKELQVSEIVWLPRLDRYIENTGHSDMLINFISEKKVMLIESTPIVSADDDEGSKTNALRSQQLNQVLETINEKLVSFGFEVIRVPAVKVGYFLVSSANALNLGNGRYFVAKSKLPDLQFYNVEMKQKLGPHIKEIEIPMDTHHEFGSIHCLTKTYGPLR